MNREAVRRRVTGSAATYAVMRSAFALARASGGAFDPCVAPALVRFGFLPGQADARPAHGWQPLELGGHSTVRFARPLTLDLGGIAKGYAVDCAGEVLERHGIVDYCVNA